MIPASYLFKTIYRDAWGIGLDAPEEGYGEPAIAVGHRSRRWVGGAVLGISRALAMVGKMAFPSPRGRKIQCAQCHG